MAKIGEPIREIEVNPSEIPLPVKVEPMPAPEPVLVPA